MIFGDRRRSAREIQRDYDDFRNTIAELRTRAEAAEARVRALKAEVFHLRNENAQLREADAQMRKDIRDGRVLILSRPLPHVGAPA